jgi:hypothetical protein
MNLAYVDPAQKTIKVTLSEGETLGDLVGPTEAFVPVDPDNRHYAAISEASIAPYTPPSPPNLSGSA